MSFYNMIHGVNPCTFFILPMLGKHPDEYPRFRDCFVGDEAHPEFDDHIIIFTRTGGANRKAHAEENDALRAMEGFVTDYDDAEDYTYANWVFKVPEKWAADFEQIIKHGDLLATSPEYREELNRVYPKLKEKWDKLFNPGDFRDDAACELVLSSEVRGSDVEMKKAAVKKSKPVTASKEPLPAAAQRVVDAWVIPGVRPSCHRSEQDRLRRDWPVLARAIEALVDESYRRR